MNAKNSKVLLYVGLGFLIVVGLQLFAPKKGTPPPPTQVVSQVSAATSDKASTVMDVSKELTDVTNEKEITLSTSQARISNQNAVLSGWSLPQYFVPGEKEGDKVSLQHVVGHANALQLAFDHPDFEYLNHVQGTLGRSGAGENTARWIFEDDKIRLERNFTWETSSDVLNVTLKAKFKNKTPGYAFVSVLGTLPASSDGVDHHFLFWKKDEKSSEMHTFAEAHKLEALKPKEVVGPISWMAAVDRYFILGILSDAPKALVQTSGNGGRASLVYPVSGDSIEIPLKVFVGPKKLTFLRKIDPTLDHVVDLGWFTFAAYPILDFMNYLYRYIGNYGIAIIILTIILKVLTFPLTYKSMKSMKDMAKIQPQIARLREKYADNKEKLNQEMISLMKTSGYNPVAGCLPMLIQIPIFIALYRVLYSSIELYRAPFGLWIHDLSIKDPFYVTPIVLVLVMVIQQRLTPTQTADPMQAKMMQWMPVIFGLMMVSLPSGLTIYMLTNAIVSIIQQIFLNKKLDLKPTVATPAKA